MNKKGQGISMNVIIIAAIALLVLVILAVLLLRAGGNVATGTNCQGVGGDCDQGDTCDSGYIKDITKGCENENPCCIPLGAKD
ncbi:hypothetical protein CMO92_00495 [Candidatus Woesearchaeota archaeon]|nr:hypothetical protein [Candidatus Woesearchaeota archaeon]